MHPENVTGEDTEGEGLDISSGAYDTEEEWDGLGTHGNRDARLRTYSLKCHRLQGDDVPKEWE